MIECIFTIDYEIYGNGDGSLRELVYEPAEKLMAIFRKRDVRYVLFVEVAELEIIENKGTDPAIDLVKNQIRDFYRGGFELGLHLHPQWYKGRYENGRWLLDYSEYNLCTLPRERIIQIVEQSIAYFRNVLGVADFTPLSFRAGNWLFQPSRILAEVLSKQGIKIDSSVFKGGIQHQYKIDYRKAMKNGFYWKFTDDVNVSVPQGLMVELPIHTNMVWPWQILTSKRLGLQQKASSAPQRRGNKHYRLMNFMRFKQPLKFDFCRMTLNELKHMVDTVINEDQQNSASFRPIIAIGHTKDLIDFETVESFLSYLGQNEIRISTFEAIYHRCSTSTKADGYQ